MNNFLFRAVLFCSLLVASVSEAQKHVKYDLSQLFANGKLFINPHSSASALADETYKGVSCVGVVWLKGFSFSTGSIDIDLRGKNVFQQSFLGIAFHGIDSITYDAIYFRPFNFQSPDTLRRKHMVQYISEPDYPWDRLRKEHPLVYENAITQPVTPADWFHAHIVVTYDRIIVFVNHSAAPSLTVKKLNNRGDGLIGLWDDGLPGDFANLVISRGK